MPVPQSPFDLFLRTGSFGRIGLGTDLRSIEEMLGPMEDRGKGSKGWHGVRNGNLQIWWTARDPRAQLIGIYFTPEPKDAPSLAEALKATIPFTAQTTQTELELYLDPRAIPRAADDRILGVVRIRIGACVTATFDPDTGFLQSLIATTS